jgi:hemerythrin
MPIKFVWDNNYSVGNEVIDSQHRCLFDLGNEIQSIQLSEVTKNDNEFVQTHEAAF